MYPSVLQVFEGVVWCEVLLGFVPVSIMYTSVLQVFEGVVWCKVLLGFVPVSKHVHLCLPGV